MGRVQTFPARIGRLLAPALLLGPVPLACRDDARSQEPPTVAQVVDRDTVLETLMAKAYGMGTDAAQRMIIDSLGATPWVAFHWSDEGADVAPGAIAVTEDAGGTSRRILPEPAWTIRDVANVRVDVQDDSSALVVLNLARTRATNRFVARASGTDDAYRDGVLLVNGRVLRVGAPHYLVRNADEVPFPIGMFSRSEAERVAARLRAARARYARPG